MPDLHTLDGVVVDAVPAELALYPFGVFTTFVVAEGRVLGWREHLERLARDARTLWSHELDGSRVRNVVEAHISRLRHAATMRISLFPEEVSMASPADARGCRILVSSGPAEFPFVPQRNFAVCTVEYQRELSEMKSTAIFPQIRLRRDAQLAGYDDVLFRRGDQVLEGATWTVLSWREGEVVTPGDSVLRSITAAHLSRIAAGWGWRFQRRVVSLEELSQADLVLAVNANCPARAIRSIDGMPLAADESLLAAVAVAYSALPRDPVAGSRGHD